MSSIHNLPKNISIDVRMLQNSGIGMVIKSILSFIHKHFELVYLIGRESEIYSYYNQQLPLNVKIIHTDIKIYTIKEKLILPFLIPRVDVHLTPHFNTPILPVRAKQQICIIHDIYHIAHKESSSQLNYIFAKINILSALRKCSYIMVDTHTTKSEIEKYFSTKYSPKIYPLHISVTPLVKTERLASSSRPYILFVGNVKPHKNLNRLVKAYVNTNLSKNTDLYIVGKKEGFITADKEIDHISQGNSNIKFTGYVTDIELVSLYQNALFFVFPSLYEGFGIPPLEAMSVGIPVLASNIPCIREVCEDAVFYFNPYNIEDITTKLDIFARDKRLQDSYIEKGYAQVEKYSLDQYERSFIGQIRSII